jgi:hypothetical protein
MRIGLDAAKSDPERPECDVTDTMALILMGGFDTIGFGANYGRLSFDGFCVLASATNPGMVAD